MQEFVEKLAIFNKTCGNNDKPGIEELPDEWQKVTAW